MRNKEWLTSIVIIGVFAIWNAYSYYKMVGVGVYNWHIHTDEVRNGFCFLAIFVLSAGVFAKIFLKKSAVSLILIVSFALIKLGLFIPYIIAYLYIEAICYIGDAILKRVIFRKNEAFFTQFIVGLCVWLTFAIIISILGIGRIEHLRIMTLILVMLAILLIKAEHCLLIEAFFHEFNASNQFEKWGLIFCVALSILIAAKTNVGQDVDSLWYMLKPEYMLIGEHSFYDYLGYGAFVYYYPKLVELFLAPLGALGDYSFVIVGNIMIYNLLMYLLYYLFDQFCIGLKKVEKIMLVVCFVSIPAIGNIAATAKSDIFGCFLVIAALAYFFDFRNKKDVWYIILAMIALALSICTKLTFILWGGILFLSIIIYLLFVVVHNEQMVMNQIKNSFSKKYLLVIALGMFSVIGIQLRTVFLVGVPIYPLVLNFWQEIGFNVNYGFISSREHSIEVLSVSRNEIVTSIASRLYSFFIDPADLSHTIMCWPTALMIQLLLCTVILNKHGAKRLGIKEPALLFLFFSQLITAIYFSIIMVQPDGNYFIVPWVIVSFLCIYHVSVINREIVCKGLGVKIICTMCVLLLNIPLLLVSNWSWGYGMNISPDQLIGETFDGPKYNENIFKERGYHAIAEYLEQDFADHRVIISGNEDRIQAAVETYWSLFTPRWSAENLTDTYEHFCEYVKYANVEGFVVLNNDETILRKYVERLAQDYDCVYQIIDEGAIYYQFNWRGEK